MAVKTMNKKGIFFTFISVVLMASLIIILTPRATENFASESQVAKTRVVSVNNFILDLKSSYLENILEVSSHKAIIALTSYVEDNGPFADLNELQSFFSEAMLQGTIDGNPQEIMEGNTIINWTDKMANVSRNTLNVETGFRIGIVAISQLRPFFVELNLSLNMSVVSETSLWNITSHVVNAELSIQNLDDPYYIAYGDYNNKINKTDTAIDEWNTETVLEHITHGTYRHNEGAPNFLQRFTSLASPSSECCGIESIVDSTKVVSGQKSVSYMDYTFLRTSSDCPNLNLYTANGIPADTKFDFSHLVLYNITQGSTQICPS